MREPTIRTVIPQPCLISSSEETEKMLAFEEKAGEAVKAAAKELSKLHDWQAGDYWARAVPQAMYHLLDSLTASAAIAAAAGYLRSHGFAVGGSATPYRGMRHVLGGDDVRIEAIDSKPPTKPAGARDGPG